MADSKTLRLLLVEDDLEDEQLLTEAFLEIEENQQWCDWRSAAVVHVEELRDAVGCLRVEPFDAILLNLSLPDSPILVDTFEAVQADASGVPIIVLADNEDENLAHLLLRNGAQDVLVKTELECAGLARSIRYAIERQRRNSASFCSAAGALSRESFLAMGAHYADFSRVSQVPLLLASVDISGRGDGEGRAAGEVLSKSAEILRRAFEPPALIGRLGPARLGLVTAGLTATTVEAMLNRAGVEIEAAARMDNRSISVRFTVGAIDLDSSLEVLLGQTSEEFAARAHGRAKTAMLAD